jgi:predicted nucleic acid-binding Zn ribbon protein
MLRKVRTHHLCALCKEGVLIKQLVILRQGPMDKRFCSDECAELWVRYRHHKDLYYLIKMSKEDQREFLCGLTVKQLIHFYYV